MNAPLPLFVPTEEQAAIERLFNRPDHPNIKVVARAGSGKTACSRYLTHSTSRRGVYLAFGKKNADEARAKFPKHMIVKTTHALAYAAMNVRERWDHKLKNETNKWPLWRIIREFGIGEQDGISAEHCAYAAQQGLRCFLYSADPVLTLDHVRDRSKDAAYFTERLLADYQRAHPMALGQARERWETTVLPLRVKTLVASYTQHLYRICWELWEAQISQVHPFPMEHDTYLKLWQLSQPIIPDIEYLIADECQDLNPCILDILLKQPCQVVMIGDPCQPTGTQVSVCVAGTGKKGNPVQIIDVPIEELKVGDKVVSYDISSSHLRKTGSSVLGVSSRPYDGDLICITTNDGRFSKYTPNHRCVVRIADAFDKKHIVYLMKRGADYRVGSCQAYHGKENCLDGHRLGFIVRAKQERADAVWILAIHNSADEARLAEHMVSCHYGIPMNLFIWSQGAINTRGRFTDWLNQFWCSFGNNPNAFGRTLEECAALCLSDFKKDIRFPLWKSDSGLLMLRRAIVVHACNLEDGMTVLTNGSNGYSRNRASLENGEKIKISREHYKGLVWSMDVERDHTYVGDGIVTHNCQGIFGFRRAINALDRFDAETLYLSLSFRFGQVIADVANAILRVAYPNLVPIRGNPHVRSQLGAIEDGRYALVARTNAGLFDEAVELARLEQRFHVVGSLKDPIERARSVYHLWAESDPKLIRHPDIKVYDDWLTLKNESQYDAELARYVRLIADQEEGVLELCDLLEQAGEVPAKQAEVVLTTVHKSKGLEYPHVRMANDFNRLKIDEKGRVYGPLEEIHVLYVGATRAEQRLELNAVAQAALNQSSARNTSNNS